MLKKEVKFAPTNVFIFVIIAYVRVRIILLTYLRPFFL